MAMAQQSENLRILTSALIYTHLFKTDPAFAEIYQKKFGAKVLHKGSASLLEVVSHYQKTGRWKLELRPQEKKKAWSSDSSSESDEASKLVRRAPPIRKIVNSSKSSSEDSSDESSVDEVVLITKDEEIVEVSSDDEVRVVEKSDDDEPNAKSAGKALTTAKPIPDKTTKKVNEDSSSDDDSDDDNVPVPKTTIRHISIQKSSSEYDSSSEDDLPVEKSGKLTAKSSAVLPSKNLKKSDSEESDSDDDDDDDKDPKWITKIALSISSELATVDKITSKFLANANNVINEPKKRGNSSKQPIKPVKLDSTIKMPNAKTPTSAKKPIATVSDSSSRKSLDEKNATPINSERKTLQVFTQNASAPASFKKQSSKKEQSSNIDDSYDNPVCDQIPKITKTPSTNGKTTGVERNITKNSPESNEHFDDDKKSINEPKKRDNSSKQRTKPVKLDSTIEMPNAKTPNSAKKPIATVRDSSSKKSSDKKNFTRVNSKRKTSQVFTQNTPAPASFEKQSSKKEQSTDIDDSYDNPVCDKIPKKNSIAWESLEDRSENYVTKTPSTNGKTTGVERNITKNSPESNEHFDDDKKSINEPKKRDNSSKQRTKPVELDSTIEMPNAKPPNSAKKHIATVRDSSSEKSSDKKNFTRVNSKRKTSQVFTQNTPAPASFEKQSSKKEQSTDIDDSYDNPVFDQIPKKNSIDGESLADSNENYVTKTPSTNGETTDVERNISKNPPESSEHFDDDKKSNLDFMKKDVKPLKRKIDADNRSSPTIKQSKYQNFVNESNNTPNSKEVNYISEVAMFKIWKPIILLPRI